MAVAGAGGRFCSGSCGNPKGKGGREVLECLFFIMIKICVCVRAHLHLYRNNRTMSYVSHFVQEITFDSFIKLPTVKIFQCL